MSSYSEKLRDPRWQKKRLEILQRDEWQCFKCHDKESTLHVHHLNYTYGKDPWDYEDSNFLTLCVSCHEHEKGTRPEYEEMLLSLLREHRFLSDDIYILVRGFLHFDPLHSIEVLARVYELALSDEQIQRYLIKKYFKKLSGKTKNAKNTDD